MTSPAFVATPTFGRSFASSNASPYSHTPRKSFDAGNNYISYGSDAGLLDATAQLSQTPTARPIRPPLYVVTEHWRAFKSRWIMLVLFGIGCLAAVAHYAYYASLHGKEADRQLTVQYRGSAIAYLAKVAFVGSIIVSFQQQMWLSVRKEPFSIGSIDRFFAATSETTAFLDMKLWSRASIALLVAAIVWIAPIMSVVPPATLTVEQSLLKIDTQCPSIKTLNFSAEEHNDWRKTSKIDGDIKLPLSWWNTTCADFIDTDPDCFDYYTTPNSVLNMISQHASYAQKPIPRSQATSEICGLGWNCSFVIDFTAPGYQCSDVVEISAHGSTEQKPESMRANVPFDPDVLVPIGSTIYVAKATLGDYAKSQIDAGPQANNGKVPAKTDPTWSTSFARKVFRCDYQLFQYSVLFNFSSGTQNTTVLPGKKIIEQIQNTTLGFREDGSETASPSENFVFPKDVSKYRLLAAYRSLGVKFRETIDGNITLNEDSVPIVATEAINTKLISFNPYLPYPDLKDRIQSLYEDILLSLLSKPEFIVVTDATNFVNSDDEGIGYNCTKTRLRNVFKYHKVQLILSYGFFVITTGLAVFLGIRAQRSNAGKFKDNKFSTLVAATRGGHLDSLDWKLDTLGHVSRDLESSKIIYTADVRKGMGIGREVREGFCKVD
ncbi:hypothetical protein GLAREA_11408 [Glarea lozoyensis ATCC 20868]|uniref:Uncharacterized protein n=1 Tax=Glarea lozoyensis (strain ATCC 20868 / MF5171) TaxID=1116229 RepID=S3CED5_GLAL2|nr:uncharacterized protein GLAREA_11408 [Glarea lozoyensis ATCC 20868]EPE24827.1 hypothetical protein GLAREA_11408 [Glarea lozoyensis ATCC 20868]